MTAETTNTEATLIELDSRRRTALGKVGRHSRYLVRETPTGTLIFEPAVVLTELEAALLARPDILAEVAASRADPQDRRPRVRPEDRPALS